MSGRYLFYLFSWLFTRMVMPFWANYQYHGSFGFGKPSVDGNFVFFAPVSGASFNPVLSVPLVQQSNELSQQHEFILG
jgi:hypothetical protein